MLGVTLNPPLPARTTLSLFVKGIAVNQKQKVDAKNILQFLIRLVWMFGFHKSFNNSVKYCTTINITISHPLPSTPLPPHKSTSWKQNEIKQNKQTKNPTIHFHRIFWMYKTAWLFVIIHKFSFIPGEFKYLTINSIKCFNGQVKPT